jgi:REP element-mobilizing transposase RayT
MNQEQAIPLAYFITFTCYGTWLHGEKSTSVDRQCKTFGTDFLNQNPGRAYLVKKHMSEKPYLLDYPRRNIVLSSIEEVCTYRKWTLLAAHVRTNHVHIVVHAFVSPNQIMNTIKAYASRYLNKSKLDDRVNRWTRHGSTRFLWKEEHIEATIQYVVHEQGEPMAVFENKDRAFINVL